MEYFYASKNTEGKYKNIAEHEFESFSDVQYDSDENANDWRSLSQVFCNQVEHLNLVEQSEPVSQHFSRWKTRLWESDTPIFAPPQPSP